MGDRDQVGSSSRQGWDVGRYATGRECPISRASLWRPGQHHRSDPVSGIVTRQGVNGDPRRACGFVAIDVLFITALRPPRRDRRAALAKRGIRLPAIVLGRIDRAISVHVEILAWGGSLASGRIAGDHHPRLRAVSRLFHSQLWSSMGRAREPVHADLDRSEDSFERGIASRASGARAFTDRPLSHQETTRWVCRGVPQVADYCFRQTGELVPKRKGGGCMGDARTVFFYGALAVAEGVPKEFLGTPHFVDEDGQPDYQLNEYMLARRNGDWMGALRASGIHAEVQGHRVLRAKTNFLRTRAYQLDAFRRWCRSQGLRPTVLNEQGIDQYAEDLEEGLVTGFSGGLLPQSVNQHLASIIDFLLFATARGWRERTGLTVRTRRGRASGRQEKRWGYALMRRTNPAEIDIWYTEDDITTFIEEFETAPAKLAAKIMYATGLRISEVLSLTLDDIPSIAQFRADRARRYLNVVGKYDKRRRVPLTEAIVTDIGKFVGFERRSYARRLQAPTDILLIASTSSGSAAPLKARALQKEFKRAREAAEKLHLSPHLLRHHYAAHYLLRAWRARQMSTPAFDRGIAEPLLSHELLVLKQNLGHSSLDTTTKYLHAVGFLCGSDIPDVYARSLMDD